MPRCPQGHSSRATDYCDICGVPMQQGSSGTPDNTPEVSAPQVQTSCPYCGAPVIAGALFCENCGYDLVTGSTPLGPPPIAPAEPEPERELVPQPEPEAMAQPEPEAVTPPEPERELVPQPEPETVAQPEPEAAPESAGGLQLDPEPEIQPEPAEFQLDSEPETQRTPELESQVASEPEPQPLPEPVIELEADPEPQPEQEPERPNESPITPAAARQPPRPAAMTNCVAEVWIDPDWYALQSSPDQLPSPGLPGVIPLRRLATIGRPSASRGIHPDIDCDPDTGVSRVHAQLSTDGSRWFIEDTGSANGTFIGRVDSTLPQMPISGRREITSDDRIYVGSWTRIVVRPGLLEELQTEPQD